MYIPRIVTVATATHTLELATFGLIVERVDALDDLVKLTYPTAESPEADGVVRQSVRPTRAVRELVIRGTAWAANASALRTQLARLKYHVQDGDLVVSTVQHSGLEFLGRGTEVSAIVQDPQLSARQNYAKVAITITCFAAFARKSTDDVHTFSTSTVMPQGSARTRPIVTVLATGSGCTDPHIDLYSGAGVLLASMEYSDAGGLTLPAGDSLVIDCSTGAQEVVTSLGARSNAAKYRTMASTFPIYLDPRDGDWLATSPTYPHLAGSVATGTATFTALYRQRFG
jgi:hypothetical protein